MNNDILAGISGVFTFELPQNRQSATGKSQSGDFLSLLQQQLDETSAPNTTGELTDSTRIFSFSGIAAINPLLADRPEKFEIPVRNDQFREDTRVESFKEQYADLDKSDKIDRSESRASEARVDDKTSKDDQGKTADKAENSEEPEEETAVEATASEAETADEEVALTLDSSPESQNVSEIQSDAIADLVKTVTGKDDASVTEVSDSGSEVDAETDRQTDFAALIEELAGNLTEEEKSTLVEALQSLSPEEFAALTASPEAFKEVLGEMIASMTDSEAKDKLLTLTESPELMQLLQNLAEQQKAAEAVVQVTDEAENRQKQSASHDEELTVSPDPTQLTSGNETANAAAADNSEGEALTEEKAAGDTERHKTTRNTKDTNVENSQIKEGSDQPQNQESLREEFKRLNQPINEAASSSDQAETADEPVLANKSNMQTATAQPVTPEQAKAAVEEAARKFISLFADKTAGGEKATAAATYSPEAVKRHSAMNNNSADHGSNGFSSHNGTPASSMSAARPATPVPAATQIFSQMLEKAEYLKTENGSKILNMELDPGELGKLEMELTSRDGTVSARISAESALAKARLEELAPQIKEQLLNQGVNLTEITVDISSRNPDESNRNQMYGRKNRSGRIQAGGNDTAEAIIRKNVLPNLRRAALNIKAVDLTV